MTGAYVSPAEPGFSPTTRVLEGDEDAWVARVRATGMARFGQGAIGKSWGTRLVVVEDRGTEVWYDQAGRRQSIRWVLALCKCGNEVVVRYSNIKSGNTKSCGSCISPNVTHHARRRDSPDHRLYEIWCDMLKRCRNPHQVGFHNYGGRGIKVCDEWQDFIAFRDWARSHGYDDTLTIERNDVDGDYEPANCSWIPFEDQGRNRRNNHMVTAFGETKCLIEWTEDPRCAVQGWTLSGRLERGWSPEDALTTPVNERRRGLRMLTAFGETKYLAEWARDPRCIPQRVTLQARLRRGWSVEDALTTPIPI